ncbi:cyclic nucleotide-binding domain-containing protein [Sphingopyxis sp. BSN-002]|uniref:cyclic nucleotide-binding domain-containing protein n=1 Tax=Sphingopyxis sp. BSN-002 TaxID=2911495 RepID=UPI001EDC9289|nr:cyclic nucleotide-binding domain-containing protein [Sphingopyxis sp. BSN-002]UKK85876.1 cyclic nucleotide-binding domain-containing protein [Sphingopyxis sp. BSN-002]
MSLLSATQLADVPLFAGLGDSERMELADAFVPRHFADGEAILIQNERAEGLFLIGQGSVDIGKRLPGGGLALLAKVGAGEVIGDMALVGRDLKRSAMGIARGPVSTWYLPADQFRAALSQLRPASLQLQTELGRLVAGRVVAKAADIAGLLAEGPDAFTPRPQRALAPIIEDAFTPEPFLAKLPCCATMTAAQRLAFWNAGARVDAGADTDLALVGAAPDKVWLVVRGAVRSALPHGDGIYQLTVTGPGQLVGIAAMLLEVPHDRLLRTSEQATLLAFDRATFAEMMATGDALSRELGASVNADLVTALDALDQVEARILAMRRGHAVAA